MSNLQNDALMVVAATAITWALTSLSLINGTATYLAWFKKTLNAKEIEDMVFKDVLHTLSMTFFTLAVHLGPLILLYTSVQPVSANFGASSAAQMRYDLMQALLWCYVLSGPFNLAFKLYDTYICAGKNGRFIDMYTKTNFYADVSLSQGFLFTTAFVNAGTFLAVIFVMITYNQIYVTQWNYGQTSVSSTCVLVAGLLNAVTYIIVMLRASSKAIVIGFKEAAKKVKNVKITGNMRPKTVGELGQVLQSKQGRQSVMSSILSQENVGEQHQLIGVPLTYNKATERGITIAGLQNTIIKRGKPENLPTGKGVTPTSFAVRVVESRPDANILHLYSQESARHIDNLIGGSVKEFAELPRIYQCRPKRNIGLDLYKQRRDASDNTGSMTNDRRGIKEYYEKYADTEIYAETGEFTQQATLNYAADTTAFCYFMYEVAGYGVGWGTYLALSPSVVLSFCLWNIPFWIGIMLDVNDGVTMAFIFLTLPLFFSLMGRVGQFWELACFGFLSGFFILFSGRALGFSQAQLGPFSDASWDRDDLDSLAGVGKFNVDINATYFAFSIASLVFSMLVFLYQTAFKLGCFGASYTFVRKMADVQGFNPVMESNLVGKFDDAVVMPGMAIDSDGKTIFPVAQVITGNLKEDGGSDYEAD